MKFILKLNNGIDVLVSAKDLERIADILAGAEKLKDESVDKGMGTHGYSMNYVHHIVPFNVATEFAVQVMPQDTYDAIKLATKLAKGAP